MMTMTLPQRAAPLTHTPHRAPYLNRLSTLLELATPLRSEKDLIAVVEGCIATNAIDAMVNAGLTTKEVSQVLPPRTLSHRKAKGEKLTIDESERAIRLARILAMTEAIFGGEGQALQWLRKPMRRLSGKAPLEMLITEAGGRLVEELLIQIDEGYGA